MKQNIPFAVDDMAKLRESICRLLQNYIETSAQVESCTGLGSIWKSDSYMHGTSLLYVYSMHVPTSFTFATFFLPSNLAHRLLGINRS